MTSEWTRCRLGDLLSSIDSGVSVNSVDRPADEGELGILKLSALSDGRFRPLEHKTVLPDEAARVSISPRAGRILISRANTPELVGACAYVDVDYPNLFLPDLIWQLEPGPNQISMRWLAYLLDSDEYRGKIRRLAAGSNSSMIKITKRSLSDLEVRLPPLGVQERHVEVLGTWDRIVRTLESLITARRERKRGLMQVLLTGKKRFKEYDSVPWKKACLSQLGRVASGGTPSTRVPDYWNGEHAWCTPSEVTALESRFIESTARRITEEGLRASAAELLPPGSLIVCTRATIGDCAINAVPMAMNQGFKAIVPRDDVDVEFLYYKIVHAKPALLRLANGSTFLEVSKRDFEGLEIEVPCLEEQKKIASVLSTADAEIENLEMQLAAYRLQKRGLMQQLLTGNTRMKVEDLEPMPA